VTQWTLPRPFNVDETAGGHTTFYVRRWASDGLDSSAQELSLFEYEAPPPGGGDGDIDGDGDGDGDGGGRTGCACRSAGAGGEDAAGLFAAAALVGLIAFRRRSR